MRVTISKEWRFDAAHQLPNHDGKCAQPHGHTYTVAIGVSGLSRPLDGASDEGMVVDFAVLDDIWRQLLEPWLDHQDLNVSLADFVPVTTSERIAEWIWAVVSGHLGAAPSRAGLEVEFVRVSETPSTYAEVRA